MKKEPTFYVGYARSLDEYQAFEDLLLQLVSDHLGRRIHLIPFMGEDQQKTFTPKSMSSTMSYQLLYCNELHYDSFYVSIFPKDPMTADATFDLSTMPEEPPENVLVDNDESSEPINDLSTMTLEEQFQHAIELSMQDDSSSEKSSENEGSGELLDDNVTDFEDMTEEEQLLYAIEISRQNDSTAETSSENEDEESEEQLDDETEPDISNMTEEEQLLYALGISSVIY